MKPKKNYGGALDLSNDEAYLPESSENANNVGEDSGPMTFTGSVSRESTPVSLNFSQQLNRLKPSQSSSQDKSYIVNLSASNPNLSSTAPHSVLFFLLLITGSFLTSFFDNLNSSFCFLFEFKVTKIGLRE